MRTKFFFVADLHGSSVASIKAINAASFYGVKNIIIGGDLTGKQLVPIVDMEDGTYAMELFGEKKRIKKAEVEDVEKEIRSSGFYYSVMSYDEYLSVGKSRRSIDEKFIEAMLLSLDEFFTKARERLAKSGAKLYIIPGNDDYKEVAEHVKANADGTIVPFDEKIVDIDGYSLLGYGYSNPTPWHTPREKEEKEIYADLRRMARGIDASSSIYAIHVPPYDTKIDQAPKLTKDLKPITAGGYVNTQPVGSVSVRRIIEEYPPIVGLHGHVHESGGIDYVQCKSGSSVPVLNPGSDYNAGILRGIIVELEGGSMKRYTFTKG